MKIFFAGTIALLFIFRNAYPADPADSLKSIADRATGQEQIEALIELASIYRERDSLRNAERTYYQALDLLHEEMDINPDSRQLKIRILLPLAEILLFQNADYGRSLEMLLNLLPVTRETGDLESEAKALVLTGFNYRYLKQYDKANSFIDDGIRVARLAGDTSMLAAAINEKANIFYYQDRLEESKELHLEALELARKISNNYIINYIIHDLAFLFLAENDYRRALEYFMIDHQNCIKTGDKRQICISSVNIATMFLNLNIPDSARLYLSFADSVARNAGLVFEESMVYDGWRNYYLTRKDYRKAYYYLEKFKTLSDSIFSMEKSGQIAEMTAKYESGKKEAELAAQKARLRNFWTIMIISAVFVAVFITFLLLSIHRRKMINRELARSNELINRQKENLAIAFDILTKREKELEEANSSKNTFFSIIAHDLKNPFGTLLGFTELLKDQYDSFTREELEKIVHNIYDSADSLYKLLGNLLEWTRTQTDRMEIKPESFDIVAIIRSNIELHSQAAKQKEISLNAAGNEPLMVYADRAMTDFVIRNLISNAIKYVPIGGEVSVYTKREMEKVRITVSDNGTGIPAGDLEKLFRIDGKVKTRGTAGEQGTGLGLIICREFLLKNQGDIEVESAPGNGSRFKVTLPAREAVRPS